MDSMPGIELTKNYYKFVRAKFAGEWIEILGRGFSVYTMAYSRRILFTESDLLMNCQLAVATAVSCL